MAGLARGGNYKDGADPRLVDILTQAADGLNYDVRLNSGYRPGDKRQHGKKNAVDIQLIDRNTGRELDNYQNASDFREYEKFAQIARTVQQQAYPDLDQAFRWGGYFSGPPGKYGALDTMHFDLAGGKIGMAGGSWDKGLTAAQRRHYPGVVSSGLRQSPVPPMNVGPQTAVASALDVTRPRVAPTPFAPPARGNVPSNLIADSFTNNSAAQYQRSLADMFGYPIGPTPHLTKDGRGVTDPAGIVFGKQMETNIFPNRDRVSGNSAPSARTTPKLSASDFVRGNTPPASAPMIPQMFSTQPRSDSVESSPKWDDFARTFNPQTGIPGPNAPPKSAERLAASSGVDPTKVFGAGPTDYNPYNAGVVPLDAAFAPLPRPRPERPAPSVPTTRAVTEMVANPEWDAWKKKTDEVGTMPTWDAFANTFTPKKTEPPRQISVTRQVPVAAPKVAPVPFIRPASFPGQQPQRAPLRITVNGGNVQQPQSAPSNWAPQGYTNDGTGKITSNETGGVYYERHLRK